jgi:hypothetical protein
MVKIVGWIFLLFISIDSAFAQTDTVLHRGTIKIAKKKDGKIYIKAIPYFNGYDFAGTQMDVSKGQLFQPFPVVEGYAYPFNYSKYLNDKFSSVVIDLQGKEIDTVVIEVKVLAKGKVYIKDKSKTMMVNGVPAVYNEKEAAYELNNLHLNCLGFMRAIKKWIPGYVILPKKGKFKGEVVVKPDKKNTDVTGTITIIFSTTPFDK